MRRLRNFVLTSLLGGLAVILPLLLFVALARWLSGLLRELTRPLAEVIGPHLAGGDTVAFAVAVAVMLAACFLTGVLLRTRIGAMAWESIDHVLARLTPGYGTLRDTVGQLLGSGKGAGALRGEVALVRLAGPQSPVSQIAIVTARHADGSFTVYVPTAPLPTQGFVYHLRPEVVELRPDIGFEAAMRVVLACGSGAAALFGTKAATGA
jgi:uncharacterized membrane protein